MKNFLQTIGTAIVVYFIASFIFTSLDETNQTVSPSPVVTEPTPTSTTELPPSTIQLPQIIGEASQSTKTKIATYSWTYESDWSWELEIPVALYDYFKQLPRPPTENYSVYVTHPLDDPYVDRLAEKIIKAAQDKDYDSFQTVELAASFVQSLPYTSDSVTTPYDEYPRYPIETLYDNGGDCEDTSILLASIIDKMGYEVVLIEFPDHLAVGVKGSDTMHGSYWEYQGNRYFYIETTGENWGIGELSEEYNNSSAYIHPMISVPILTHDWTSKGNSFTLELKVTVNNLGSAMAEGVYVYAGFDAGNDQSWNHKESSLFDLGVNESVVATIYLTPPLGVHTRLVIQIVYDGYAVDQSYSEWFDTY